MNPIIILIIILSLGLLINCQWNSTENFQDMLDKVNSMEEKIDSLVDQEKETRTFCKLLHHDSSNQEQLKKIMEHRNREFEANWKKQNKMLSDIKKKIIDVRLGKNNKEFADFNTGRNKERQANLKRKEIMESAKKMIKQKPALNLTIDNNI